MEGNPYFMVRQARDKQRRYQDEASVGRLWLARWSQDLAARLQRWQERLEQGGGGAVAGYPERTC